MCCISTINSCFSNNNFQAITQLKWTSPTDVQQKSIPLVLDGKDILLKARTGSGKTAAYIIPIIQWLLNVKKEKRNNKDFGEMYFFVFIHSFY